MIIDNSEVDQGSAGAVGGSQGLPPADQGVYPISVASELTGIEPHLLRAWEKAGLLLPGRSTGGTRRYSANDLTRLRHIEELADAGLNLPGIRAVLRLEDQTAHLRAEIDDLREQLP